MTLPLGVRLGARLANVLAPVLRAEAVQRAMKARVLAGPPGPTDKERAAGQALLWGEVSAPAGRRAVSRLRAPEGYTLTTLAALEITRRVLEGAAPAGFQSPFGRLRPGPDPGHPGLRTLGRTRHPNDRRGSSRRADRPTGATARPR